MGEKAVGEKKQNLCGLKNMWVKNIWVKSLWVKKHMGEESVGEKHTGETFVAYGSKACG